MKNRDKGFTLIELLLVIAILGVIGGFVIIKFSGAQTKAHDTRRQSELKQYQIALENYANNNNNLFPIRPNPVNVSSLCSLLGSTQCPDDPKTTGWLNYQYQSDSAGFSYVLWARIEKTQATSEFFVLCSTGQSGQILNSINVSDGNCPL